MMLTPSKNREEFSEGMYVKTGSKERAVGWLKETAQFTFWWSWRLPVHRDMYF